MYQVAVIRVLNSIAMRASDEFDDLKIGKRDGHIEIDLHNF